MESNLVKLLTSVITKHPKLEVILKNYPKQVEDAVRVTLQSKK